MPGPSAYFTYEATVGRHPKEKQKDVYVKRKDQITKTVNIIPKMMAPIKNHRKFVPAHQILEEDYHAYRNAAHIHARAMICANPDLRSQIEMRDGQCEPNVDAAMNSKTRVLGPTKAIENAPVLPHIGTNAMPFKKPMTSPRVRACVKRAIPLAVFRGFIAKLSKAETLHRQHTEHRSGGKLK